MEISIHLVPVILLIISYLILFLVSGFKIPTEPDSDAEFLFMLISGILMVVNIIYYCGYLIYFLYNNITIVY